MASSEIELSGVGGDARQIETAKLAAVIEHITASTDIAVDLNRATRLPIDEIAALGTAFSSLPKAFRTVQQTATISGAGFLQAFDEFGRQIDFDSLQAFKQGGGRMGSLRDATKGFRQARLQEAAQQTVRTTSTMPFDPTSLFMAAAIMEMNKKLDAIAETQHEMLEYVKNKDRAALRGDLETLSDVLASYRFNWDNGQYKTNKHILVQQIRSNAGKAIIQHRAELRGKLKKKGLVRADKDVKKAVQGVREELEEYRLAVYLHAFSSFLEVMLLENFDPGYLKSQAQAIEEHSIEYRELYTTSYNLLEADAGGTLQAMTIGGLSSALGLMGRAVEKTPVGARTTIDEALVAASEGIGNFGDAGRKEMLGALVDAASSDVRPFVDSIESVNRLYNEPAMLIVDADAIYVLPIEVDRDGGNDAEEG